PDCIAEDVTAHPDGTIAIVDLPSCAENGHVTPCWQLVDLLAQYEAQGCQPPPGPVPPTCKLPLACQPIVDPIDGRLELYSFDVDRGIGGTPPPNTTTQVSCATIASPTPP
ncbi:MAG TPA: hypothetical protein VF945_11840, partial [Polyangia bacterium]